MFFNYITLSDLSDLPSFHNLVSFLQRDPKFYIILYFVI